MRLPPRLWNFLHSRRVRIGAAWTSVAVVIGIVGFYAYANFSGPRALKELIAGLPSRGYATTIKGYLGSPGSPEQDLFSNPAMIAEQADQKVSTVASTIRSLKNKTKRQLDGMASLLQLNPAPVASEAEAAETFLTGDPVREARWRDLRLAFQAPQARWPGSSTREIIDPLFLCQKFINYARWHALSAMVAGKPDEAVADFQALADLERHLLESHPTLTSGLIAYVAEDTLLDLAWEGVRRGCWDEPMLARMDSCLSALDPAKDAVAAFRGEIAVIGDGLQIPGAKNSLSYRPKFSVVEWVKGFSWSGLGPRLRGVWMMVRPAGLDDYDQMGFLNTFADSILTQDGHPRERFDVASMLAFRSRVGEVTVVEFIAKGSASQLDSPWRYAADAAESSLTMEADLKLLRTGIALERYRLKHGAYPAALTDLTPDFLTAVPVDPFTGKALLYRQQADGSPLVWSVGANLIDDGGLPRKSREKGDRVWNTQAIPGLTERDYMR